VAEEPQPSPPEEKSDDGIDIDNLLDNTPPAEISVPRVEDKAVPPAKDSWTDDWDIDGLLAKEAPPPTLAETNVDEEYQPSPPAETSDDGIDDIDNLLDNTPPAESSVPRVEDKVVPPVKGSWTDDWEMGDIFAEDVLPTTPSETTGDEEPQSAPPAETSVSKVEDKVVPPAKDSWTDDWDLGDLFTEDAISATPGETTGDEGKEKLQPLSPGEDSGKEKDGVDGIEKLLSGENRDDSAESARVDKSPPKRSFKGYVMGAVLILILLALASEGPSIIKRVKQATDPSTGFSAQSLGLSIINRLKGITISKPIKPVKEEIVNEGRPLAGSGGKSLFGQTIIKRRQQIASERALNEETADNGESLTPEGEEPKIEEESITTEESSSEEDATKAILQEGSVSPTDRADMLKIGIIIPVYKSLEEVKVLDMVLNIEFTNDTVANVIRSNILFYEDNIEKSIDRFFNGKFYDDMNFVKGDLANYIMDDMNKTLKSGQVKRIEIEFLKDPTPEIPAGTEVKKK